MPPSRSRSEPNVHLGASETTTERRPSCVPSGASAAFTTGQAATLIPVLPGGLGVAEGSIEALMSTLGVDAGEALVAAMLFRLCYYVAPALLSVLVLWGLKVSEPAVLQEAADLDLEFTRRL